LLAAAAAAQPPGRAVAARSAAIRAAAWTARAYAALAVCTAAAAEIIFGQGIRKSVDGALDLFERRRGGLAELGNLLLEAGADPFVVVVFAVCVVV
jgi:hypothetical protein